MKIKRMIAFRVIALLMLTALIMIPLVPASASPGPWAWFPGKNSYHCVEGSYRNVSICSHPTDLVVTNKTIPYGCQQYYDIVFGAPVGNVVPLTVPKDSYHSDPFFLKTAGPLNLWCQVYLKANGNGSLGIANGALKNVSVNIAVTGNGSMWNATEPWIRTTYFGGDAPAGSVIMSMPLNMDVWIGKSPTDPTMSQFLFTMDFPMITTTGTINVNITDVALPYPQGPPQSLSMNGYKKTLTGVPFDNEGKTATLAGGGAGLDIFANVAGVGELYTDYIFVDAEVLEIPPPVGGAWIPVDKLALLAPYIALASAIILAVAAIAIFKYRKKQ